MDEATLFELVLKYRIVYGVNNPATFLFKMIFRICITFIVPLIVCFAGSSQVNAREVSDGNPVVRFAVSLDPPQDNNAAVIAPTIQVLKKHFGEDRLKVVVLKLPDLEKALENGSVDIFLATSGLTRRMAQKGARDLVTLVSDRFPNPNKAYGSLFIARSDSGIQTLEDMKGRSLVANMPGGFYGYQIAMGRLIDEGFTPESFFSHTEFLGRNLRNIVQAVVSGRAEVGVLSSCFLEDSYPDDSPERKLLSGIALVGDQAPCMSSTELYPNWSVSSMPSAPAEVSKQVAQVLLTMPATVGGLRWSIATDFSLTDGLFKKLQLGPFGYLKKWFITEFLRTYWQWIVAVVMLILGLAGHALLMQQLVRRRTEALRCALDREIALKKQAQQADDTINALQKFFAVGQFGSMIAHELRQPLATILAFAHGSRRFLEQGKLDEKQWGDVLDKIQTQAQKAEAVIERVRCYAKNKKMQKSDVNLSQLLLSVCREFKNSERFVGKLVLNVDRDAFVLGNAVELHLVIANLLHNAVEALTASQTNAPMIEVELKKFRNHAVVFLKDNGLLLTNEQVEQMRVPLSSTKEQGLGLGLAIVEGIVKAHDGRILLKPNVLGGLCVRMEFPLLGVQDER